MFWPTIACVDAEPVERHARPDRSNAPADTSADTGTDTADTGTDTAADTDWPRASWLGLNANAPLDVTTGALAETVSDPTLIAASGAGWVRLNFLLGPWLSPADPDWQAAFDTIVDGFVAEGVQVYGLVGAESVVSGEPHGSETWRAAYVQNVVTVIDHFKDRVRVWESYNEPNNWVAEGTPALSAEEYALLLQDVYLQVKHHNGHVDDPTWQVTLVSGPLFTHDLDDGAAYLSDAYWYGRNVHAWDWTHGEMGSYPLDGIGAHLYVAQGETTSAPIAEAIERNLSAMQAVIDAEDPGKRFWLSEVGWNSDSVGEDGQAEAVANALEVLRDDPRVAMTAWFTVTDWPGQAWGIRWDVEAEKAAWARFVEAAVRP